MFTGGIQELRVIGQEELDTAADALSQELFGDASEMFQEEVGDVYAGSSFELKELHREFSVDVGDQADSYELTMEVEVTGLFYDNEALASLAVRKLYEGLGQGMEFVSVSGDELVLDVQAYDAELKEANVHVTIEGKAITSQTSQALNVGRFVGMKEDAVKAMLLDEGVAQEVSVEFFPFWVKRVPRLKDHIFIEIY